MQWKLWENCQSGIVPMFWTVNSGNSHKAALPSSPLLSSSLKSSAGCVCPASSLTMLKLWYSSIEAKSASKLISTATYIQSPSQDELQFWQEQKGTQGGCKVQEGGESYCFDWWCLLFWAFLIFSTNSLLLEHNIENHFKKFLIVMVVVLFVYAQSDCLFLASGSSQTNSRRHIDVILNHFIGILVRHL